MIKQPDSNNVGFQTKTSLNVRNLAIFRGRIAMLCTH